jgi:uncharacterized membrane protein
MPETRAARSARRLLLRHPVNVQSIEMRTLGERVSDALAERVGSWGFILVQSALLTAWIAYNAVVALRYLHTQVFDPFPFILLNLVLSFQAAYTGPVVMMSQNRHSQKDRAMAEHDYTVNRMAIEHLAWQNAQILALLHAANTAPSAPPPSSEMP